MTWLKLSNEWTMPADPAMSGDPFHIWCIGRSVDEGRMAAMRWLIEFVGIVRTEPSSRAARKTPHQNGFDVMITDCSGGTAFDHKHPDAKKLADLWKGCSQASMHATGDTGHPDVSPHKIAEALEIVLKHLDAHLYQPNGLKLIDIVRGKS